MPDFAQWDREVHTSIEYFGAAVNAYAPSTSGVLAALESRLAPLEKQGVAVPASLSAAVEALRQEMNGFHSTEARLTENLAMLTLSLQMMIGHVQMEVLDNAVESVRHMVTAGHAGELKNTLVLDDDELIEQLNQARMFVCAALIIAGDALYARPELIMNAFKVEVPDLPTPSATARNMWMDVGVGSTFTVAGLAAAFLGPVGVPVAIGAGVVGLGVATVAILTRAAETLRLIKVNEESYTFYPQTEAELVKWLPAIGEQTAEVEKLTADCASGAAAMVEAIRPPEPGGGQV